ncbi:hypothetical protein Golomagni_02819 [Golovinomyces magnicellulatus]|nr:hypothetical protein Golomagni_02819 [Golovinomyces magnicellulatus]
MNIQQHSTCQSKGEKSLPAQDDASDSEYHHALEVIFDEKNAHRRRSSLVSKDLPDLILSRRKNTEFCIHAMLDCYRKYPIENLDGIAKSLLNPQTQNESSKSSRDLTQNETTSQLHSPKPKEQEELHSRLLNKKQLSEMALGVRELSKRLGSIRLKLQVNNIFLLTKAYNKSLIEKAREIARWLLSPERHVQYTVWVEDSMKDNDLFNATGLLEDIKSSFNTLPRTNGEIRSPEKRLKYWHNEMCKTSPHTFDFVVTLGGDGTVLYANWLFQRIVPPVLSFALGSLGFLTKFDYEKYQETLTTALKDGVTISLRLRLEATIMRSKPISSFVPNQPEKETQNLENRINIYRDLVDELVKEEEGDERTHRPDSTREILNDVVVDRGPNPLMSSIELFSDNQHMTSVAADGICVATPTGSTAYNLAAGGSLCHPDNPVILVTAICAHTLSFRPIILPDTVVLRVGVPYDARTSSWASFDGRERVELRPGDYVTISASRYPFANVMHPELKNEDWTRSISEKLGWNTRQKQEPYS